MTSITFTIFYWLGLSHQTSLYSTGLHKDMNSKMQRSLGIILGSLHHLTRQREVNVRGHMLNLKDTSLHLYFTVIPSHMVIAVSGDVCAGGQSCLTLCNPMDCAHQVLLFMEILQARILECVAISFSRASSQPKDWTHVSCIDKQILYHYDTWETNETNTLGEGRCNSTYVREEKKQNTCQHPQG